jgi:hypothetical protein
MIRRGKETIFELNDRGELVKKFKDREPHPLEIPFSKAEWELYEEVSKYTSTGWTNLSRKKSLTASEKNVGKFLLTLVQKRMVSSLAALRATLGRRMESIVETRTQDRIDGRSVKELQRLVKGLERGEFMEDEDREAAEHYLETRRVQAMYAERTNEVKTLRDLHKRAEELIDKGCDSKLKWLIDFLKKLFSQDPNAKVIIFTEYKDTLDYLKESLEKQWFIDKDAIVLIHGGMPLGEDENEVGSKLYAEWCFNEPNTRVLLATDAASEGLNLQRYCHIMVNYELPWNPNRLEQRIGRIHRYGQRHIASVYNLMIKDSKEADIFKLLQEKIETIRKQLGNMAEVLGVLEQISLDELMLRVLSRDVGKAEAKEIAEVELKKMDEIAESLRKTQFLSGCRQFTREDIKAAEGAIAEAQRAIPTHKDVKAFVETFLRVYGDEGKDDKDGRRLHGTKSKEVFRLLIPSVVQDDKLPKCYDRVTFDRKVATKDDWPRHEEPEFLAFGHPLLERMVAYCRKTRAAELSGKLCCLVADYAGLPGVILNYILRFEDKRGRVIREEVEPVFVDIEGKVQPSLGPKLFLAPGAPQTQPNQATLQTIQGKIGQLREVAENHIRQQYQTYYERAEEKRNEEIGILIDDLERFDRATADDLRARLKELTDQQLTFLDDPVKKGQRTRIENQIKIHEQRMQDRRVEVENMRLGAFPAPELLNMVVVTKA